MSDSCSYQGPLGSAAIFVPPSIMTKLQNLNDNGPYFPESMNSFFGKNEIPRELSKWRDAVNDNQNPGLALRWVSALEELKEMMNTSYFDIAQATFAWNSEIS